MVTCDLCGESVEAREAEHNGGLHAKCIDLDIASTGWILGSLWEADRHRMYDRRIKAWKANPRSW
jgi:hypothetical protein